MKDKRSFEYVRLYFLIKTFFRSINILVYIKNPFSKRISMDGKIAYIKVLLKIH